MIDNPSIDVSVVIVNYNVKHFADQCLRSIYASQGNLAIEIFLVDNASTDGSIEYLQDIYQEVVFIINEDNLGFGRANNIALRKAKGRYLLILNPDTLLGEDSLGAMVDYMDNSPAVGAMGPMILTRDGSFDISSKRGLPTPWVAFCRLSGLARLFPRTKLFGRYNLLYLDQDKIAEVDALAGSCMIVRREVYECIGGFDEDFFMYGEDIDWCHRIKLNGWQVHYAPVTKIVHFKGESTRRSDINRDHAFYGAMHLFVEKHFKGRYPRATHWLIDIGILLALGMAKLGTLWRLISWSMIDWIGIWGVLALGRLIRWGTVGISLSTGLAITLQTTVWTLCLAGFGAYGRRRGQLLPLIWAISLGFLINSSFTYFFKQIDYSRFLNLFGFVVGGLVIWAWRLLLNKLPGISLYKRFYKRRTLLIGTGEVGRLANNRLKTEDLPYIPVGFVDLDQADVGTMIDGLPVLGSENEIPDLVEQEEIEEVLFTYDRIDYNRVLNTISQTGRKRRVSFKVITPEITVKPDGLLPLLSVEYLSPRGLKAKLRKFTTLVLGR